MVSEFCSTWHNCVRMVMACVFGIIKDANVGGVDHVAVAFYVDCFACVDDVFGHICFVVEG